MLLEHRIDLICHPSVVRQKTANLLFATKFLFCMQKNIPESVRPFNLLEREAVFELAACCKYVWFHGLLVV